MSTAAALAGCGCGQSCNGGCIDPVFNSKRSFCGMCGTHSSSQPFSWSSALSGNKGGECCMKFSNSSKSQLYTKDDLASNFPVRLLTAVTFLASGISNSARQPGVSRRPAAAVHSRIQRQCLFLADGAHLHATGAARGKLLGKFHWPEVTSANVSSCCRVRTTSAALVASHAMG